MMTFLTEDLSPSDFTMKSFFNMHREAIEDLADGAKLREQQSQKMRQFFTYCKRNFFIVCTNTQLVERWVRYSNECTQSGKDEHFASLIALCVSTMVFRYKEKILESVHKRVLRAN